MPKGYLNPTIHCYVNGRDAFHKRHLVKNVESRLQKFERYALSKFPGADYVNYYWSDPPYAFAFRRYLTPQEGHH